MIDQTVLQNEPMANQIQHCLTPGPFLFIILYVQDSAFIWVALLLTSVVGVW